MHLSFIAHSHLVPWFLYGTWILSLILSIFRAPVAGVYFLTPLILLQTIRYRIIDMPLGHAVVDITLFAVTIGLLRRGELQILRTPLSRVLLALAVYTYVWLWVGSLYLGVSFPYWFNDERLVDWKNYMALWILYFVALSTLRDVKQIRIVMILMCFSVLLLDKSVRNSVGERGLVTYTDDLREGGLIGFVGANGMGAFESQFAVFLLAFGAVERKRSLKAVYYAMAAFSSYCVMLSFSRGAYLALLAGAIFLGIVKQRSLLVLVVAFLCVWQAVVPKAVSERVLTTYTKSDGLESSANERVSIWEDAVPLLQQNPIFGIGFNTYAYLHRVSVYTDTHNMYLKVAVETGALGLVMFLWFLMKAYRMGYRLFREAEHPFFRSLGLGLAGWIIALMVANCFGDRFTYLQVSGYTFLLMGMVYRCLSIEIEQGEGEKDLLALAAA